MWLKAESGNRIQIRDLIARGGEGSVYQTDNPEFVVKLYHNVMTPAKLEKLKVMVASRSSSLEKVTCWPSSLVIDPANSQTKGFLMPTAAGRKEIHKLYSPKSRLAEFPTATFKFLVAAAANTARAFAVVHREGHVIGDVNHSSVMVAADATVRLIDCDSFQVSADGRTFKCEVGEAMHTPPELQGLSLAGVERTRNHDVFGLAVLIFELLFMGRHPYAGKYMGSGELSLEQKIKRHLFAYGKTAASLMVEQPQNTLTMSAVTASIGEMFERAFLELGGGSRRPSAEDWVIALTELGKLLIPCRSSRSHWYLGALRQCPWCVLEANSGTSLFVDGWQPVRGESKFDIGRVWSEIEKVKAPPAVEITSLAIVRSLQRTKSSRTILLRMRAMDVVAGSSVVLGLLFAFQRPDWLCPIVVGSAALVRCAIWLKDKLAGESIGPLRSILAAEEARFFHLCMRWDATASHKQFDRQLDLLRGMKEEYMQLAGQRRKEYELLEKSIRDRQLDRYLDRFRIDKASISNIGRSRCAVLRSNGVETAADVSYQKIIGIQGFGDALTSDILAWRKRLETKFRFDHSKGVDKRDLDDLERRIARKQRDLEVRLANGANELSTLARKLKVAQDAQWNELVEQGRRVGQLRVDLKGL